MSKIDYRKTTAGSIMMSRERLWQRNDTLASTACLLITMTSYHW